MSNFLPKGAKIANLPKDFNVTAIAHNDDFYVALVMYDEEIDNLVLHYYTYDYMLNLHYNNEKMVILNKLHLIGWF